MSDLSKHDNWLTSDGAAAIVIREPLGPVEGPDGVFFPATFAAAKDKNFPGGYNIDPPTGDKNVCLVDSVGSQANRIEPIFTKPEYIGLVPQIVITAGERSVNLLEAGHRAGDAIVRCTPLQKRLQDAFKSVLRGDALDLAKIAPTSLVFGVWDSRDTQAKLPRLVASTIRAFDVQKLTRSAQFNPSADYIGLGLLEDTTDKKVRHAYAERGFIHVPAGAGSSSPTAVNSRRLAAYLGGWLFRPPRPLHPVAVFPHNRGLEPQVDEIQNAPIHTAFRDYGQQFGGRDAGTVLRQVGVYDGGVAGPECMGDVVHGIVGRFPGSQSVRVRTAVGCKNRFDEELHRHLRDPVAARRYPQRAQTAVRFGDHDAPHRGGSVGFVFQVWGQVPQQRCSPASVLDGLEADPLDAGTASVGPDKPPRVTE